MPYELLSVVACACVVFECVVHGNWTKEHLRHSGSVWSAWSLKYYIGDEDKFRSWLKVNPIHSLTWTGLWSDRALERVVWCFHLFYWRQGDQCPRVKKKKKVFFPSPCRHGTWLKLSETLSPTRQMTMSSPRRWECSTNTSRLKKIIHLSAMPCNNCHRNLVRRQASLPYYFSIRLDIVLLQTLMNISIISWLKRLCQLTFTTFLSKGT